MNSRAVFCFIACAGLALASARSYNMSLIFPVKVGSTELKAGDYRIEIEDNKVVIRSGRVRTEASVRVEENATRYKATNVRITGGPGEQHIREIWLGGTRTRLVVTE